MSFKALAGAYNMCCENVNTHGQTQLSQPQDSLHTPASHDFRSKLKLESQSGDDCKHCNLCHAACGSCIVLTCDHAVPVSNGSHEIQADHSGVIKTQASDPPYRPKWRALA
jgi:hypothetical protein